MKTIDTSGYRKLEPRQGLLYRHFFSLVELLIVIAILAILSSLLQPALKKALATGTSLQCSNHLKQWAFAFSIYTDENNDWMPFALDSDAPGAANWNAYNTSWAVSVLGKGTFPELVGIGLYRTCPAVKTYTIANGIDYGMNDAIGVRTTRWKVSAVRYPGMTFVLADARIRYFNGTNYIQGALGPRLDERHLGNFNVQFVDGHVAPSDYRQADEKMMNWQNQ
jgi:prepilin-type N-terminal cleavage/methylation domain-containing protein/prepilin-type processing-associated H-X9-DG protein